MSDSWPSSTDVGGDTGTFERRAARREHTLKTLEALDAFRAEAAALRADMETFREQQRAARKPPPRRPWEQRQLPDGFARLALEAVFLVVVAFALALLDVSKVAVVVTMGVAWIVAAVFESVASAWAERPVVRYLPPAPAATVEPLPDPVPPPPQPEPVPDPVPEPDVPPAATRRRPRFRRRREEASV